MGHRLSILSVLVLAAGACGVPATPPASAPASVPVPVPAVALSTLAGAHTELARYRVPQGERIIFGQRIDGVVRVTDRPAGKGGRAYLVERGLETKAELDALVADYVAQAEKLNAPPLAARAVLEDLETAA